MGQSAASRGGELVSDVKRAIRLGGLVADVPNSDPVVSEKAAPLSRVTGNHVIEWLRLGHSWYGSIQQNRL